MKSVRCGNQIRRRVGSAHKAKPCARPLRIGIDARDLLKTRTGVEQVVFHFIASLPQLSESHEYLLFTTEPLPDAFMKLPYRPVIEPARFPLVQRIFDAWLFHQLPALLKAHEVDVFYSPNTKGPWADLPVITTVHGLEWRYFSSGYSRWQRIKQRGWFEYAARRSAGIVTFSQHTHRDFLNMPHRLGMPVCVVPEGVGTLFRRLNPGERQTASLQRYGIAQPFILSVCTLERRKNIETLIRAFALLKRQRVSPHRLVLVGKHAPGATGLRGLAHKEGLASEVTFTGYVPDEDLVQLYNHADVFVYPSLYEGFGLPIVEAMACGVPVITTRRTSLPEVAGNAALLVDGLSVPELAGAMERLINDDRLSAEMAASGLERASQFSWIDMARRIMHFIVAVNNQRRAGM